MNEKEVFVEYEVVITPEVPYVIDGNEVSSMVDVFMDESSAREFASTVVEDATIEIFKVLKEYTLI